MLRRLTLVVGALFLFADLALAQTADDLVAKTIAAQHLEKMKPVQSVRMTGTIAVEVPQQPSIEGPITIEVKRPNKVRVSFTLMGMENAQGYDGTAGWSHMTIQQQLTPQPATADELKDLQEQADLDGTLVDYKAKGHQIELVGKEAVSGVDTYKLKVTKKNGDVQYEYIDAQNYLPVKMDSMRTIQGTPVNVETFVGDYRDEGGVLMPHTIEARIMGVSQRVTVKSIEINAQIDDARFKMPVVK